VHFVGLIVVNWLSAMHEMNNIKSVNLFGTLQWNSGAWVRFPTFRLSFAVYGSPGLAMLSGITVTNTMNRVGLRPLAS
jgi:hypothetical protein